MIVADSNLIASCVLKSEATTAALALLERDPDWRVPRLWRYEMLNILATMIKAKRLSRSDAETTFRQLLDTLRTNERDPDSSSVLSLVEQYGISGYDAHFVALARDLGVKLYTQDRELLKKFPETAVKWFVRDADVGQDRVSGVD